MRYLVGCVALSALLGCKGSSPGAIHFVGLKDGPCPSGVPTTDAQPAAATATMIFGVVPLRVAPWGRAELSRVKIRVADDTIVLPSPTAVHSLDTTKRPDGELTLAAEAEDSEGGSLSTQVRVCVDNHAPRVELQSPPEDAVFRAEDAALAVRWRADDLVGVRMLRATLTVRGMRQERACTAPDASGTTTCTLSPVELPLKLPAGGEEKAELTVLARDEAGHEASITRSLRCKTRLAWTLDAGGSVRWPVELVGPDRLAVATDVGRVLIVNASTHNRACPPWVKPPEEDPGYGITTPLAATESGAQLYFGSYYNLWRLSVADCQFAPAPLYSLSLPPDGNMENKNRWCFTGARPAIKETATATIVLVGLSAERDKSLGVLRAIDGQTGVELSSTLSLTAGDTDITSSPVLSEDRMTLYVGTPEGKLHAVGVSDAGQLSFKAAPWPIQAKSAIRARPLLLGAHLYASTVGGELLALDAATGAPLAGFPLALEGNPLAGVSGAAGADRLYAGSAAQAGLLFSVKTTGGAVSQRAIGQMDLQGHPTVSFVSGEPVVYAAAQVAGSATGESARPTLGRLYALAPDLSAIYWYFETEREFIAPPVARGTTVYIGNANGFVYALDATR